MKQPEEQQPNIIPPNFIEKGKFMGGMFDIRNAIEGGILAAVIIFRSSIFRSPLLCGLSFLCMTALPLFMISLIGIGGQSISAFLRKCVGLPKTGVSSIALMSSLNPKAGRKS
ncbi:MAG: cell division protein FtsW [Ruminococcus sp.]